MTIVIKSVGQSSISADPAIGLHEDELKLLLNSRDWHMPFTSIDLYALALAELDRIQGQVGVSGDIR